MQAIKLDPVIAEVRAVRDEYAARFDYDVGRMFRDIQTGQEVSDRKYICFSGRRPTTDLKVLGHEDAGDTSGQ